MGHIACIFGQKQALDDQTKVTTQEFHSRKMEGVCVFTSSSQPWWVGDLAQTPPLEGSWVLMICDPQGNCDK